MRHPNSRGSLGGFDDPADQTRDLGSMGRRLPAPRAAARRVPWKNFFAGRRRRAGERDPGTRLQEYVAATAGDLLHVQRETLRKNAELSGATLRLTALVLRDALEDMCRLLVASNGASVRRLTPETLFRETLTFVHYSATRPCLRSRILLHDVSPLAARVRVSGYIRHLARVFGDGPISKLPKATLRKYLAVGMSHFRHLEVSSNVRAAVSTRAIYRDDDDDDVLRGRVPVGDAWHDLENVRHLADQERAARVKARADARWPGAAGARIWDFGAPARRSLGDRDPP